MRTARIAIGLLFLIGASLPWHDVAAQQPGQQGNGETQQNVLPIRTEVIVSCKIVEVQLDNLEEFGVQFGLQEQQSIDIKEMGVNFENIERTHENLGIGDYNQFFDAIKESDVLKILAEPTLVTQSGQPAQFLSGGQFPVVSGGESPVVMESPNGGLTLLVTPHVTRDGTVVMQVQTETSEIPGAAGGGVPVLAKKSGNTVVLLQSGQTAVIGGVIPRGAGQGGGSVPPVLANLPILGALFRSEEHQKGNTGLLIFITPKIVRL